MLQEESEGGGGGDFLDVLACRPLNCPGQSGAKPSQFVCFTPRGNFGEYHQIHSVVVIDHKHISVKVSFQGDYSSRRLWDIKDLLL